MLYDVRPQIRVDIDYIRLWAFRLSKAGYGAIDLLLSYPSDIFLDMIDYEDFIINYGLEQQALNQRG